jgi:hypothetical protein
MWVALLGPESMVPPGQELMAVPEQELMAVPEQELMALLGRESGEQEVAGAACSARAQQYCKKRNKA